VEYRDLKEKEEDNLRMQGGYEIASMPLKRQRSSMVASVVGNMTPENLDSVVDIDDNQS